MHKNSKLGKHVKQQVKTVLDGWLVIVNEELGTDAERHHKSLLECGSVGIRGTVVSYKDSIGKLDPSKRKHNLIFSTLLRDIKEKLSTTAERKNLSALYLDAQSFTTSRNLVHKGLLDPENCYAISTDFAKAKPTVAGPRAGKLEGLNLCGERSDLFLNRAASRQFNGIWMDWTGTVNTHMREVKHIFHFGWLKPTSEPSVLLLTFAAGHDRAHAIDEGYVNAARLDAYIQAELGDVGWEIEGVTKDWFATNKFYRYCKDFPSTGARDGTFHEATHMTYFEKYKSSGHLMMFYAYRCRKKQWLHKLLAGPQMPTAIRPLCPGTREWAFDAVCEWREHAQEQGKRVFVIAAEKGWGKTCFAAVLPERFCFVWGSYFFDSGLPDNNRNNARQLIMTWAWQLSKKLPDYKTKLERLGKEEDFMSLKQAWLQTDLLTLFTKLLRIPLSAVSPPKEKNLALLVDAVDECDREGRSNLLSLIKTQWVKLPPWLLLIVTCRPSAGLKTGDILDELQESTTVELLQENGQNSSDIQCFSETLVKSFCANASPQKVEELAGQLASKAENKFLYLHYAESVLRREEGVDHIQSKLDSMPRFENLYAQEFEKVASTLYVGNIALRITSAQLQKVTLRCLQILVAAKEPLSRDRIASLLDSKDLSCGTCGAPCTRPRCVEECVCNCKFCSDCGAVAKIALWCTDRVFGALACFFPERNGRIHFWHSDLREWLISPARKPDPAMSPGLSDWWIDEQEGHRQLAKESARVVRLIKSQVVERRQKLRETTPRILAMREEARQYAEDNTAEEELGDEAAVPSALEKVLDCFSESEKVLVRSFYGILTHNSNNEPMNLSDAVTKLYAEYPPAQAFLRSNGRAKQYFGQTRRQIFQVTALNSNSSSASELQKDLYVALSPTMAAADAVHRAKLDAVHEAKKAKLEALLQKRKVHTRQLLGEWDLYCLKHVVRHLLLAFPDAVASIVCDLRFVESKAQAGLAFNLVQDYDESNEVENAACIRTFKRFVQENARVLSDRPHLTEQCAMNWAGELPASMAIGQDTELWYMRRKRTPKRNGLLATLHTGSTVTHISISPDKTRIASGHHGGEVKIWNVETTEQTGRMACTCGSPGEECSCVRLVRVRDVCFSSDSEQVLSAGQGPKQVGWAIVWNLTTEKKTSMTHCTKGLVVSASLSLDMHHAVTGGSEGCAKVWCRDGANWTEKCQLPHGVGRILVSWSTEGRVITAGQVPGTDGELEKKKKKQKKKERIRDEKKNSWVVKTWDIEKIRPQEKLQRVERLEGRFAGVSADGMRILQKSSASCMKGIQLNSGKRPSYSIEFKRPPNSKIKRPPNKRSASSCKRLSADGTRVVSTHSMDGVVETWTWNVEPSFSSFAHGSRVTSGCISTDGTQIASGGDNGQVLVWDAASGIRGWPSACAEIDHQSQRGNICAIAFSTDGRRVAFGSTGGHLTLWDTGSAEEKEYKPYEGRVYWVGFEAVKGTLVSAGKTSGGWAVKACENLRVPPEMNTWREFEGAPYAVSLWLGENDSRVVSGSGAGEVRVDSARDSVGYWVQKHAGTHINVSWRPDGKWVVSGGSDKWVRIWDAHNGTRLHELFHGEFVYCVNFSADGARLAFGDACGKVKVLSVESWLEQSTVVGLGREVNAVVFCDEARMITASRNLVSVCDAVSGQRCAITSPGAQCLSLSRDGSLVCGGYGQVRLWRASAIPTTGAQNSFRRLTGACISPDGARLACAAGARLQVWGVQSGKSIWTRYMRTGTASSMRHIKRARKERMKRARKKGFFIDTAGERSVGAGDSPDSSFSDNFSGPTTLCFSSDGRRVASGSTQTVTIWDAVTGERKHTVATHDKICRIALSSDGSRLASASVDHTLQVWERSQLPTSPRTPGRKRTLVRMQPLKIPSSGACPTVLSRSRIQSMRFSENDKQIIYQHKDKSWVQLDIESGTHTPFRTGVMVEQRVRISSGRMAVQVLSFSSEGEEEEDAIMHFSSRLALAQMTSAGQICVVFDNFFLPPQLIACSRGNCRPWEQRQEQQRNSRSSGGACSSGGGGAGAREPKRRKTGSSSSSSGDQRSNNATTLARMGAGSALDAGTQQLLPQSLQQQCQAVVKTCSRVDVNTKATVINMLAVDMGLQCSQISVAQAQQPMMPQGQMMQGQPMMMQQGEPMQQQQQQGRSGSSTSTTVGGAVSAGGAGAGIMYDAQTGAFDNANDGLASAGEGLGEGAGDADNFMADGAGGAAEGASRAIDAPPPVS